MTPEVRIFKIGRESESVLRNLFQHYLRDMAAWFDEVEANSDGGYSYDFSTIWESYDVYLAKAGDAVAGFALIGWAGEFLEGEEGRDVHEFFVLRGFRREGMGRAMATHLWNAYRGEWLVRVLEANAPGLAFWRAAIGSFTGASDAGASREEGRQVSGRGWVYFRFTSTCTATVSASWQAL